MKKILSGIIGLSVIMSIGCQNDHNAHSEETTTETTVKGIKGNAYSASFTDSFRLVLDRYYTLKDAFVKSDTSAIHLAATSMKEAVAVFSVDEVQAKDSLVYLAVKPKPTELLKGLENIFKRKDIEMQRAAFEAISIAMYDLLQSLKPSGIVAYNQYCPMAFNDKGANWLSAADSIMNPYYGKKMLHCGEVKETLRYD